MSPSEKVGWDDSTANNSGIWYPGSGSGMVLPDVRERASKSSSLPIMHDTDMSEMPGLGQGDKSEISDPKSPSWGRPAWPTWLNEFRSHQIEAIRSCVEAFERGAKVVWLDAPTGSGKTIIGEGVRRLLGERGLYVCSGLQLQDQFVGDFNYAKVLKGRSNYPTQKAPFPHISCADCNKKKGVDDSCSWCTSVRLCEYEMAKSEAIQAEVAVLNTTYLLSEANNVGRFSDQSFIVLDECDLLESELMRFVEWRITGKWLNTLGMKAPVKGARKSTIMKWLEDIVEALRSHFRSLQGNDLRVIRQRTTCQRLGEGAKDILLNLQDDTSSDDEVSNFIRDYDKYDEESFTIKPIKVDKWGQELVWRHSKKWLCMSATIISAQEQAESLGLGDDEWEIVTVPMTFPVENRPIVKWPVANLTRKTMAEEYPKLVSGLVRVFENHPDDNILVHTVSYNLCRELANEFRKWPRPIHSYLSAKQRAESLATFKREGGILFAASADRGIDLPEDLCRVVVVAKTPFPSLGDRQTSERIRTVGGQVWYQAQTVRTIVQMTGRGVRHEGDKAVTYILDEQFDKQIYKQAGYLLPEWWKDGVKYGMGCEEAIKIRRG